MRTIPAVFALLVAIVVLSPVLIPAALFADLVTLNRRLRHIRLLAMLASAVAIESIAIVACAGVWMVSGAGLAMGTRPFQTLNHRMQWWWSSALLGAARATLGLELQVTGLDAVIGQPLVVLGRHISIADAAVPAAMLGREHGYRLRHVLKQDLLWGPSLDIVGQRIPNHFVARKTKSATELDAIRALAEELHEHQAMVIFPEGTFFRPSRLASALKRIAERDEDRASKMSQLRHLLPPEPGGTLVALDAAPTADIALLAHHGFDAFESLGDIYRSAPFTAPVMIEFRIIDRSEVPTDTDKRLDWLDTMWLDLDQWIDETSTRRR